MKLKSFRVVLAAVIVAAYPAASLYPFHPIQWEWFPKTVANGAEWLPGGGIRFRGPGVGRSSGPPGWVPAATQSHRLELSLQVCSFAPNQRGPARILTLSVDPFHRNLMIGQEGEDLILRLRTVTTSLNGTLADGGPVARVPGIFRNPAWIDLRIGIEPGLLWVEVGDESRMTKALTAEPLRNWDPAYQLALGNELTNDRPWLGEIRRAAVSVGNGAVDYAEADSLELAPSQFRYRPRPFTLVPFSEESSLPVRLVDAAINLVGYIPLGLFLGLGGCGQGRSRRPCALCLTLVVCVVSAGMEMLQFGVATRHPSTTDLIFNTLGGGGGVLLGLWAKSAGLLRWFRAARLRSGTARTGAPHRAKWA